MMIRRKGLTKKTVDMMIRRKGLTKKEVKLAAQAAQLIKERVKAGKAGQKWVGPTADALVSKKVDDPVRQVTILSLAHTMYKVEW